ncbi:hypothetical protein Tco_0874412 [Tanacetum coccineum]|uniref:Uncharacterized protein n=1 Tax=Tanacetum coccineum TaxID=301880 RepID=A0ABQ5BPM9_9ASTR
MKKVIKGEFKKIKDVKVEDVSLTCDTSLEVFNNEVNRLSRMDDDLFTYEVELANIPCDSKMDVIWNMIRLIGDDEVELTDEESSDDKDEVAEVFRIDTNLFNFETPMCKAFKEFNYLLQIDPDLLTNRPLSWMDDGYCNGGNLCGTYIIGNQLHYQDHKWYEALEDSELKDEALRNKVIMEGSINEGDDESRYEQERRWNIYTNYDDAYEDSEKEELCEVHELPVCNIRTYMMIKYSFNNDEKYVAVKEDEYNDLIITREEACRAY